MLKVLLDSRIAPINYREYSNWRSNFILMFLKETCDSIIDYRIDTGRPVEDTNNRFRNLAFADNPLTIATNGWFYYTTFLFSFLFYFFSIHIIIIYIQTY